MVDGSQAAAQLTEFALAYGGSGLHVLPAGVWLDVRQDGEPVTRVQLVLDDPEGDTWDLDHVRDLRMALAAKAAEIGVSPTSLTMIARAEASDLGVATT